MGSLPSEQLLPEDKIGFIQSFSYTKAIIKDNVTYPIVPNCPIINIDSEVFDASNIPVGTLFITHYQDGDFRQETLNLRVPNDTYGAYSGCISLKTRANIEISDYNK